MTKNRGIIDSTGMETRQFFPRMPVKANFLQSCLLLLEME